MQPGDAVLGHIPEDVVHRVLAKKGGVEIVERSFGFKMAFVDNHLPVQTGQKQ